MSGGTSSGWSSDAQDATGLHRTAAFLLEGVAVGLLAGMGAFVYNTPQFVGLGADAKLLLVPMVGAGAFAHLFASSLRDSIRLGLTGFFVGLAVFVGAWIAPLWMLSYPPTARDVLLPEMVGDVMSAAFLNYAAAYLGGYLLTVSLGAFWE